MQTVKTHVSLAKCAESPTLFEGWTDLFGPRTLRSNTSRMLGFSRPCKPSQPINQSALNNNIKITNVVSAVCGRVWKRDERTATDTFDVTFLIHPFYFIISTARLADQISDEFLVNHRLKFLLDMTYFASVLFILTQLMFALRRESNPRLLKVVVNVVGYYTYVLSIKYT